MVGSIENYPLLWQRVYRNPKPGAWIENQEYEAQVFSDDDPTLDKAPNTRQWQELVNEASLKFGRKLDAARDYAQMFRGAGFINVTDDIYKVTYHDLVDCPLHILSQLLGTHRYMAERSKTQGDRNVPKREYDHVCRLVHSGNVHSCPSVVYGRDPNPYGQGQD